MGQARTFLRFLALGTVVATAFLPRPSYAIVGPSQDGSAFASHVVMVLNHQGATAGFCTGIVLAPDVVVTAAHCVPKGADIRIHFPEASGGAPVLMPIVGVARHPDYHADAIKSREVSIDLAMLHLQKPLPDRFSPATLASRSGTQAGGRFVLAGYGVTKEGEATSSGQLRQATLVARAPLSKILLWAEDPEGKGTGACTGDSGAPVFAEGQESVSALTAWSAGNEGHQCGSLTQATWLQPQKGWIDRILQAWAGKPAQR